MFRVHTPIIRSIRCCVAAYGFLHRVFGLVTFLRAAVYGADGARHHPNRTQRLSRPPPIQKLGAENRMLRLNVWCSWWWAYIPEVCRGKNTLIKLPCCIELAFQIISWEDAWSNNPQTFLRCCSISSVWNKRARCLFHMTKANKLK